MTRRSLDPTRKEIAPWHRLLEAARACTIPKPLQGHLSPNVGNDVHRYFSLFFPQSFTAVRQRFSGQAVKCSRQLLNTDLEQHLCCSGLTCREPLKNNAHEVKRRSRLRHSVENRSGCRLVIINAAQSWIPNQLRDAPTMTRVRARGNRA